MKQTTSAQTLLLDRGATAAASTTGTSASETASVNGADGSDAAWDAGRTVDGGDCDCGAPVPGAEKGCVVGRFYYDTGFEVDFDDRLLAHLQIVIGSKLAKNESFFFSWKDTQAVGDGRTTIWIHPAIPLRFKYFGGRTPSINPNWVRNLLADSHTPHGLRVSEEPPEPPHRAIDQE